MKVGTQKRYKIGPSGQLYKDLKPDIEKTDFPFSDDYIEGINNQTKSHGRFIEVDEKKTKAWEMANKEQAAKRKEQADLEQALAASTIAKAADASLKAATANTPVKKKPGPKAKTE